MTAVIVIRIDQRINVTLETFYKRPVVLNRELAAITDLCQRTRKQKITKSTHQPHLKLADLLLSSVTPHHTPHAVFPAVNCLFQLSTTFGCRQGSKSPVKEEGERTDRICHLTATFKPPYFSMLRHSSFFGQFVEHPYSRCSRRWT